MRDAGGLRDIPRVGGQGASVSPSLYYQMTHSTPQYLFAYHIEALVPTGAPGLNAQREPQRLNRNRDVQFFSVGTLNNRTLIIYMKKKGVCLNVLFIELRS